MIVAFIAGGVLVGCSGAGQDEPASAPPVASADGVRPDAAPTSDTAMPEPASKPLPEGYPDNAAPIYEPSTITHVFKMGSGATLKYMVTAQTGDSVDVVAASLADDYKAQGAEVSETPLNEEGVGQVVASKDGYGIIMTYSTGDTPGTTNITYDVHKQRGRR
ncbi:hypothetical protein ACW7G0_03660 [Lysobacter sp. A286]